MSKKLLMNNYSENGLIPVMDGLICWLDAWDIQSGDTVWKDRSGNGNDFTIIGSPVIKNGYFHFNKSKPYARCASLVVNIDSVTVQCSLKNINFVYGGNSYVYSISGYYSGLNLSQHDEPEGLRLNAKGTSREMRRGGAGISSASYITTISTAYSLSLKKERAFNEKRTFTSPITGHISGMEIGKEYNYTAGTGFEGQIGSLLVYNRVLTEEEIQQNYLYEQSIERG